MDEEDRTRETTLEALNKLLIKHNNDDQYLKNLQSYASDLKVPPSQEEALI